MKLPRLLAVLMCFLALAGCLIIPACSTTAGSGSVQPRDIENLSLVATAATFAKADAEDRGALAVKLLAVTDGLDKLTGDTVTADQVFTIVSSYLGNSKPEYAVLAAVLSDYIPAFNAGGVAANLKSVSAGIKKAVAIYAPPAA